MKNCVSNSSRKPAKPVSLPLSSGRTAAFNSNEELRKQFFQEIGSADFRLPGFQETDRSSLTRSAILAIYSLLVGRGAPDALL